MASQKSGYDRVGILANRLSDIYRDDGFRKLACVAPTREDSGDKRITKKAGSCLCRMALWQWLFTRIEPKKSRVKNHMGKQLGSLLDTEKKTRPVKLARSRVCSKAAELLFRELVKEVVS